MSDISKYAILTTGNNVVTNIVLWDGDVKKWGPGKGHTTVEISKNQWCDIDSVYNKDTGEFSFPEGYTKP